LRIAVTGLGANGVAGKTESEQLREG